MIRAALALGLASSLAAADLDAFPAAVVHPDGAVFSAELALPAGEHRLRLPAWSGGAVAVRGAAWWRIEPAAPAPVADAVLQPLLDERDRLVRARLALDAEDRRLQRDRARLGERLARQADQGEGDGASWQAAVDAWLAGRAALLEARERQRQAAEALAVRAAAALQDRAAALRALALDDAAVRRPAAAARAALGPAPGGGSRAELVLASTGAPITVEHRRPDLRWSPAARLAVAGAAATLVRRAEIAKPAAADFGAPRLRLSTEPLDQGLESPRERRTVVGGVAVARADGKQIASGVGGGPWLSSRSAPPAPAASSMERTVAALEEVAAPASAALGPQALTIDLGAQALAAGSPLIGAELGAAALAVEGDELALVPAVSPVAFRRLSLRLDQRPLLPGTLDLVVDGRAQARETVAWQAPGALLTVSAGEDPRVCVGDSSAWKVDPARNTPTHRRQGHDHWLFASGSAPVTVAFYGVLPVGRSDRVAIATDPATTPGFQQVEPGLLRWLVTVAPGEPQRIGLGCVIDSNGGFRFE